MNSFLSRSELALAAYLPLQTGVPKIADLTRGADAFSTTQARTFAERWIVKARYDHSATWTFTDELGQPQTVATANGLSATVFEDTQTHKRYLAIRGTDDIQDRSPMRSTSACSVVAVPGPVP